MTKDEAAHLLAAAARDCLGPWTEHQQRAAHLVANVLAAAWCADLPRHDIHETRFFRGPPDERLAAARRFVEAIDPDRLAEIFAEFAPPKQS